MHFQEVLPRIASHVPLDRKFCHGPGVFGGEAWARINRARRAKSSAIAAASQPVGKAGTPDHRGRICSLAASVRKACFDKKPPGAAGDMAPTRSRKRTATTTWLMADWTAMGRLSQTYADSTELPKADCIPM